MKSFKTYLIAPFKLLFVVGVICPIISNDLLAQDDEAPELTFTPQEIEKLSDLSKIPDRQKRTAGEIAFAIFSQGKSAEDYYYMRNEKPEKLFFNTGAVRRFQYGGKDGRVVIYKKSKDEEGKVLLLPVAYIAPPAGSREGVVLFMPDEEGEMEKVEQVKFIDLSERAFSPNDIRMVNLTSETLVVQLNDKKVELTSGKNVVRTLHADSKIFPVRIGIVRGEKLKLIYSNVYQAEKKNRTLFMIVPDWRRSSAGSPIRCLIYKDTGMVSG